jgi:hypothetical protein
MQKITVILSLLALAFSLTALVRPRPFPSAKAASPRDSWKEVRQYPPLVFTGKSWLDCQISSRDNGRQVMRTTSGQGFSFDTPMLPIKDGRVKLTKPGMSYSFTSFPSALVPARFNGLGEGAITEMKAEIEVDVNRFTQSGGPGTAIRFTAEDINRNAAYVEFTGIFIRTKDKKPFPFRVVFGNVPAGEGEVIPTSALPDSRIQSKRVVLGTEQSGATVTTALYEAENDVRVLTPKK